MTIAVDYLICPQTLAATRTECPLRQDGDQLVGPLERYPITENVPDLRLAPDRGTTSYDDLLTEFMPVTARDPSGFLSVLGLTPDDVRDRRVLVAGAGIGYELDNLAAFQPAELHAIDFSEYILTLAREMAAPGRFFYNGDICNLPFRSGH